MTCDLNYLEDDSVGCGFHFRYVPNCESDPEEKELFEGGKDGYITHIEKDPEDPNENYIYTVYFKDLKLYRRFKEITISNEENKVFKYYKLYVLLK